MMNRKVIWRAHIVFLLFLLLTSLYGGYLRTYEVSESGTNLIFREAPAIKPSYWGRVYGEGYAYSVDLIEKNEFTDGIFVAGVSLKNSHGLWILRTDYYGKIIWERVYGENLGYKNVVIKTTNEGGALVLADYKNGIIALKVDSQGDIEEQRIYSVEGKELWPVSILPGNSGGYFILLNVEEGSYGHILLVKLSGDLKIEWARGYWGSEALKAVGIVNVSREYILAGTEYIGGKKHGVIFAVDAQGEILWKRSYISQWGDMEIKDMERAQGSKDSFIVGGAVKSKEGDQDLWLSQMTVEGDVSWSVSYGTEGHDFIQDIDMAQRGYSILAYSEDIPKSMWLIHMRYEKDYDSPIGVEQFTITGGYANGKPTSQLKGWFVAGGITRAKNSELFIYNIDFRERFFGKIPIPEGSGIHIGRANTKHPYLVPVELQPINFSLNSELLEMNSGNVSLSFLIPDYCETLLFGMPYPPWNLRAEISEGRVILHWKYNPVNISNVLRYFYIYRGTDPKDMKLIGKIVVHKNPEDVGSDILDFTYMDRNVSEGKKYYYYVTAVSDVGEGLKSEMVVVEVPPAMNMKILYSAMVIGVVAVVAALYYLKRVRREK